MSKTNKFYSKKKTGSSDDYSDHRDPKRIKKVKREKKNVSLEDILEERNEDFYDEEYEDWDNLNNT